MTTREEIEETVDRIREEIQKLYRHVTVPRPLEAWTHEDGSVLWWHFPVEEPPYVGTPNYEDFDERYTHWTPIIIPRLTS